MRGSVIYFHWVRAVIVHASGAVTAAGLGISSISLLFKILPQSSNKKNARRETFLSIHHIVLSLKSYDYEGKCNTFHGTCFTQS